MAVRLFDVRPTALARIPLLPVPAEHPLSTADSVLREALFLASPAVEVEAGKASIANSHLSATIRGYELRARWRPVPNGVFAAAAPARIGGKRAVLRLGSRHRTSTVPSGAWLEVVARQLTSDFGVLDHLRLTTCDLIIRRGERFELERPAASGETGPQRVSINATAATEFIVEVCAEGEMADLLVTRVRRRWPAAPEAVVRGVLVDLVRHGLLLTDLLPEDLWDDPLGHLISHVPASHPKREALERLRFLLTEADRYRPGAAARLDALRAARKQADRVHQQQRPLSVNVTADARLEIPESIAEAAANAVTALWRIGIRRDPLADYHRRFVERYGYRRLVPFSQVCDPVHGIGTVPEPHIGDEPQQDGREKALGRLIARATTMGVLAVSLSEADITALAHDPGPPPSRSAEIWVQVFAATQAELEAGQFSLAISGCSQDASSTAGRFADLRPLLPADLSQEDVLVAELAVQARTPQASALAPPAGLARFRIPIGVTPQSGDLRLADLHVYSDGDRLVLWSVLHSKTVIPVLYSRLAPLMLPPRARLLQMLGRAGCQPLQEWSWGHMRHHPFQPRVLYRRTVLSPARWLLPTELIKAATERTHWPEAVKAWQAGTIPAPPRTVTIEHGDRLLPLDLQLDSDRELLRRYVGRGAQSVTEKPGGQDAIHAVLAGTKGNHVLELVLSLDRRASIPAVHRPATPRPAGTGVHLPGGEWLSLALHSPAHLHDQLILSLSGTAAALTGTGPCWFWLRYTDPVTGPHLRVRFHGDPGELGGQVLPALSDWCHRAVQLHLCRSFSVEPYDQEIERYGGPASIAAAEKVFAADSQLALAIIRDTADRDRRVITAAHSAAMTALSVSPAVPSDAVGRVRLDRASRTRYELLRPHARAAWSSGITMAPIILAARDTWRESLIYYRETLRDDQHVHCASSLIHMSANRLIGNLGDEAIARALAKDIIASAVYAQGSS